MPGGSACRSLPFGPLHLDGVAGDLDGDALRDRDRFLSDSRHICLASLDSSSPDYLTRAYQMLQSTSPPTPALTAARPVMTPRDVVRMLVPRPAEHVRHVVAAEVDAAAGTADALEAGDDASRRAGRTSGTARSVLTCAVVVAAASSTQLEALDVAFVLEDPRDLGLQPRAPACRRACACAVTALRIRVSMSAIGSVISLNLHHTRSVVDVVDTVYQLLFVTPVTSPSSASLRKHRRHRANLRM